MHLITRSKNIIPFVTWILIAWKPYAYGMAGFKIASADMTNPELIKLLFQKETNFDFHGMATKRNNAGNISIKGWWCSIWNVPYKFDLSCTNVRYKFEIHGSPQGFRVKLLATQDTSWVTRFVAAVALGANIIEKHFTVDKNMEGVDHKVSLLPSEFAEMSRSIRNTEEALGPEGIAIKPGGGFKQREFSQINFRPRRLKLAR